MTFQDFKHGCGSEERHMIKGLSDQLQMFLQMCLIFSDSTEVSFLESIRDCLSNVLMCYIKDHVVKNDRQ